MAVPKVEERDLVDPFLEAPLAPMPKQRRLNRQARDLRQRTKTDHALRVNFTFTTTGNYLAKAKVTLF